MSETKPQKPFPKPMAWHDDPGFVVGFSGERDSNNCLIGIVLTRGEVGSTMVFDQRWRGESVNKKFVDLPDDHPLAAWPNAIKPQEPKKEKDFPKLMISKTNGVILLILEKYYLAVNKTWLAKGVVIESPVAHTKKGEWGDDWVFEYLIDLPDVHPLAKKLTSGNAIPESTTWEQQVKLKRMEIWTEVIAASTKDCVIMKQSLELAEAAVNEFDRFFKLKA